MVLWLYWAYPENVHYVFYGVASWSRVLEWNIGVACSGVESDFGVAK